jgi:hypothetical protein
LTADPGASYHAQQVMVGKTPVSPLLRFASRLRFPWMFALTAALFLADLLIPDLIPFADEVLLGLITLMFGTLRRRQGRGGKPQKSADVIDVTPHDSDG